MTNQGSGRYPCHFTLDFLRPKRESLFHSDFLRLLEEKIELTDYANWSRDKMVATLFLTFCDIEMGKIVFGLLSKDTLDMIKLRPQIMSLRSSPWYKGSKATAKLEGGSGTGMVTSGGSSSGGPSGRWCSQCQKHMPTMEQCWGQCIHCHGRGQQSKTYRTSLKKLKN